MRNELFSIQVLNFFNFFSQKAKNRPLIYMRGNNPPHKSLKKGGLRLRHIFIIML